MKEQSRGAAALKEAITVTTDSPFSDLLNKEFRSRAFDPDAWHVMQERDNALISDQILHGHISGEYIYTFLIKGKLVTGVSVVGARELASQYGGLKTKTIASTEKRGSMFVFRQLSPLTIDAKVLPGLEEEEDYYECIIEVQDIKTGNSLQVRKREQRREKTSKGEWYVRPHYDTIAESKAFRNGILSILPQGVIEQFERKSLLKAFEDGYLPQDVTQAVRAYLSKAKDPKVSSEKTIDQIREGIIAHSTKNGLHINRSEIMKLGFAEISGLRESARDIRTFKEAATALGLLVPDEKKETVDKNTGEVKEAPNGNHDLPPGFENIRIHANNSVTYAQCAQALNSSNTLDQLDIALDLIRGVVDSKQQEELRELEKACRKGLSK